MSFDISTASVPPAIDGYDGPCPYTAWEVAVRAVILQGVVAVACDVEPEPVVEWLRDQGIWEAVSPQERSFLANPGSVSGDKIHEFRWRQEAEWALLWVVGKVESLGLPNHQCDTTRLVDEIIPALGSHIAPFVNSGKLQTPEILFAESTRHYDLWCRYIQTRHEGSHLLPSDLEYCVLYQREYVFEWLLGVEEWDDVQCDA